MASGRQKQYFQNVHCTCWTKRQGARSRPHKTRNFCIVTELSQLVFIHTCGVTHKPEIVYPWASFHLYILFEPSSLYSTFPIDPKQCPKHRPSSLSQKSQKSSTYLVPLPKLTISCSESRDLRFNNRSCNRWKINITLDTLESNNMPCCVTTTNYTKIRASNISH